MRDFRIGHGYDVHALALGLPLRLGGVDITSERGCVAHSDGDAAIHALCDALLGAAALGDIGGHFPDSSAEFRGIDSMILLERTMELLREKEFSVVNADITIILQEPKIAPYVGVMRSRIAHAMSVGEERVSVKATTTEFLGFAGRGEGVEAHAVALLSIDN
jgi:2-C-methyl-D-erythritol 2,4-cyclodiphosphate synthase